MSHQSGFEQTNSRHDARTFGKTKLTVERGPVSTWLVDWGWTVLLIGGGAMCLMAVVR
jgi:hypothetical protein